MPCQHPFLKLGLVEFVVHFLCLMECGGQVDVDGYIRRPEAIRQQIDIDIECRLRVHAVFLDRERGGELMATFTRCARHTWNSFISSPDFSISLTMPSILPV